MFRRIPMPYWTPDGAGMGGDSGTGDIGGGASDLGGGVAGAQGGTPSTFDLSPDSLVRIPGQKDPIKFSEYKRDHISQAEYTKKTQALAAERKAWEAEKAAATEKLLAYAKKMAGGRQDGQPTQDPLADLRKQSFIDGNAAASIVETIQKQGIAPIVQAISKRDEALKLMYGQMTQMAKVIDELKQGHSSSAMKSKLGAVRDSMGLPADPVVDELLQDIYSSHEGDDWDNEFPTVAKSRIEGLKKVLRDADRKAAEDARKKMLPGRSSDPSFKSKVKPGYKSPQEWTDQLASALGIPD